MEKTSKTIRKLLLAILQQAELWDKTCESCGSYVSSLANLAEQMACCERVDLEDNPINRSFPDIKRKLLQKLSLNANVVLQQVQNSLDTLSECRRRARFAADAAKRTMQSVPIHDATSACADKPSLSEIVLWMLGLSQTISTQLAEKTLLYTNISLLPFAEDKSQTAHQNLQAFCEAWENHRPLKSDCDAILAHCSFFLNTTT